jgi:hypothetical protein
MIVSIGSRSHGCLMDFDSVQQRRRWSQICFTNLMHLSISFWLSTGDLGGVFPWKKHHQGRSRKTRSGVMGGWDRGTWRFITSLGYWSNKNGRPSIRTANCSPHLSQFVSTTQFWSPGFKDLQLLVPKIERPETRSRHLPGSWDKTGRDNFADSFLCAQLVDTTLLVTLIQWLRKKYPQCYGFHPFPSLILSPGLVTHSCWYHPVPAASGIPVKSKTISHCEVRRSLEMVVS